MDPFDVDVKTGEPVHQALKSLHPELRVPDLDDDDVHCFETYPRGAPGMVPLYVCDETLVKVAKRMHGGAGPSGADSYLLKDMLLRFGKASVALREEMGAWMDWLGNSSPPIAAYRAFANGRLFAGNKQPGVRPVCCGEIFRRYWCKVLIRNTGFQAMEECGALQLCAGLPVGLEGAVHAMRKAMPTDNWESETPPPDSQSTAGDAGEHLDTQPGAVEEDVKTSAA